MLLQTATLLFFIGAISAYAQTYSATYLPSNVPNTTEEGQTGTNQCGGSSAQDSNCQNVYSAHLFTLTVLEVMLIAALFHS